MAIWDNLLRRVVDPIVHDQLKQLKEEEIEKGLMVLPPSSYNYYPLTSGKTNTPQKLYPRNYTYQTLRDFAMYYPILRSCINYRKRQISQLQWDVSPINLSVDAKETDKHTNDVKDVKEFLRYPTGDKTVTFRSFLNKILEDLMVLDAMAVARRKNMKGGIYGYIPIDAATIELILNEDGTVPTPPDPAYSQKIRGREVASLTYEDLIYRMMNPRTNSPYGVSPVETLIIVVSTALKLSSFNLGFLSEGNVPEGFVELPKDIASNADQLKQWQEAWDAMFSGNAKYTRKIKFLPEGMKWTPIRKAEDMEFERFDKWLLLETCSVMEVPPQAIGFQFERGKGATETEWEIGKERGMYPLAHFIKEIMDQIIQEDLGQDHLEFVWTNIDPTNKKEEADVFKALVSTGAVSVDEWRLGEGLTPINLPHYIMTPVGPILVKDFVESSEAGTPLIPYNYQNNGENPAVSGGKAPQAPSTNTVSAKKPVKGQPEQQNKQDQQNSAKKVDIEEQFTKEDVVDELKRWKKVAVKDMKSGEGVRDFKSDIIDVRTQRIIKDGLKASKSKDDLDELFNPLISQENGIIDSVMKLYDEITEIVESHEPYTTSQNKTGH